MTRKFGYARKGTVDHLETNANSLNLLGQFIACLGIFMVFAASILSPVSAFDVSNVRGSILVPLNLTETISSLGIEISIQNFFDGPFRRSGQGLILTFSLIIFLIAIIRRRWIVAMGGLAFYLAPWEAIGAQVSLRYDYLRILLAVMALRLVPIPNWTKILAAVLVFLAMPLWAAPVTKAIETILPQYKSQQIEYAIMKFDPQNASAYSTLTDLYEVSPLTTDVNSATIDQFSRGFVLAQHAMITGNVSAAKQALELVNQSKVVPIALERYQLSLVEKFLELEGDVSSRAGNTFSEKLNDIGLTILFWIGVTAALIGPFSDIIQTTITKRIKRISTKHQQLYQEQPTETLASTTFFGAGNDPNVSEKDLRIRVRLFTWIALVSIITAGLMFGARQAAYLPDADQNTAFSSVGLLVGIAKASDIDDYYQPADIKVDKRFFDLPTHLVFFVMFCFLFFRVGRNYAYLLGFVWFLWATQGYGTVPRGPVYTIEVTDFSPLHQESLLTAGGGSSVGSQEQATNNATKINSDDANFTLAQIAYINGSPKELANLLNNIDNWDHFWAGYPQQRLAVMIEWASSQGQTIKVGGWAEYYYALIQTNRYIALILGLLAIAASVTFCITGLLSIYLTWRVRQISSLSKSMHVLGKRKGLGNLRTMPSVCSKTV